MNVLALAAAVSLALPPSPSRFVDLDGLKIHYKSYGTDKRALVFVHGWSCDMTFWTRQVEEFGSRVHVILLDLPGHGQSDKPPVTYGADLFARAIDAVLRDQKIEGAVLVGHSMGTPAVRQFYRLRPEKTLALVAVDGSLRAVVKDPAQMKALAARYRRPDYKDGISAAVDTMFSPSTPLALKAAVKDVMRATPQNVVVSAMEGMGDPSIWTPDPIRVPLLVVLAQNPFWGGGYEAFVRSLAPQVDYHVLEGGADHFLMLDRAEEFNQLLSEFLKKNQLLQP